MDHFDCTIHKNIDQLNLHDHDRASVSISQQQQQNHNHNHNRIHCCSPLLLVEHYVVDFVVVDAGCVDCSRRIIPFVSLDFLGVSIQYPTFSSTAAWSLYFDGSVPPFDLLGMKNESTVAVIFGSTTGRRRPCIHSISEGSNGITQYRNENNKDSG